MLLFTPQDSSWEVEVLVVETIVDEPDDDISA